jgi:hypothetical protein
MRFPDTVAAIATPPGQGAVAIVRVTGPDALAVGERIFRKRGCGGPGDGGLVGQLVPRVQHFGPIWDGGVSTTAPQHTHANGSPSRAHTHRVGHDPVDVPGMALLRRQIGRAHV